MLFGSFRTCALTRLLAPLRDEIAGLRGNVRSLQTQVAIMSAALDNLKAAVAAQVGVDQSALALIQGIASQLKSVSDDADVQSLADELSAAAAPLASAVSANTPASPTATTPSAAAPAAPAPSVTTAAVTSPATPAPATTSPTAS